MTLAINELIRIADSNGAVEQMDYDQYECLIELIEDGTILTAEQLSGYMEIRGYI